MGEEKNILGLGTCFRFIGEEMKYTVVFVTEDDYYFLCCREDGFKEIYTAETFADCLEHGEMEIISQNKIEVDISYKVVG